MFVTAQGSAYSQFKRALERRNFMLAWTMAAELPKVRVTDGLELLLLAHDLEPARFDRAVPRWHARLCSEQRLSSGEAQLALAAFERSAGVANPHGHVDEGGGRRGAGSNVVRNTDLTDVPGGAQVRDRRAAQ